MNRTSTLALTVLLSTAALVAPACSSETANPPGGDPTTASTDGPGAPETTATTAETTTTTVDAKAVKAVEDMRSEGFEVDDEQARCLGPAMAAESELEGIMKTKETPPRPIVEKLVGVMEQCLGGREGVAKAMVGTIRKSRPSTTPAQLDCFEAVMVKMTKSELVGVFVRDDKAMEPYRAEVERCRKL